MLRVFGGTRIIWQPEVNYGFPSFSNLLTTNGTTDGWERERERKEEWVSCQSRARKTSVRVEVVVYGSLYKIESRNICTYIECMWNEVNTRLIKIHKYTHTYIHNINIHMYIYMYVANVHVHIIHNTHSVITTSHFSDIVQCEHE